MEIEGRKGGKREEEKCLPQCHRYLREDTLSSGWLLFLPPRNVFLQQRGSGCRESTCVRGHGAGFQCVPHRGSPCTPCGDADRPLAECPGVPLKGMARGHGRFLGPINCLGFCFPWAESWKWRLLTSSNKDSSFQLTCQKERPDAGLWGICHKLVVFVKIS